MWRYKKRILVEDAANDHHRMCPHNVQDGVSKTSEVGGADDCVVVSGPHVIHSRLKLNYLIHVRSALAHPIHAADDPTDRVPSAAVAAGQLLEYLKHSVLIEPPVTQVGFRRRPKLELPLFSVDSVSMPAPASRFRCCWRWSGFTT